MREQIFLQEYPFLLVCDFDALSFLNGTVAPGVPGARVFLKPLVRAHEMPHVKRHRIEGIPKLTVEMNFSVEDFVRKRMRTFVGRLPNNRLQPTA